MMVIMSVKIRDATLADAGAIAAIYNHAVLHSTAIWNDTPVDALNREFWVRHRQEAGWPVLVAGNGPHGVLGYASFAGFRAFDGYRHTVEHSVYVRSDCRGQGIGKMLLQDLQVRARRAGKHTMVAAIEAGNEASLWLHRQCGFVHRGTLPQVGAKFGDWLDLTFMTYTLTHHPHPPEKPH